jgi:diguanylate cyclase (GGDEF)-like protein
VAEEIRAALSNGKAVVSGTTVTASIGVAMFPMHGSTLDDVIRVADLAMYEAKAAGRDRAIPARIVSGATADFAGSD